MFFNHIIFEINSLFPKSTLEANKWKELAVYGGHGHHCLVPVYIKSTGDKRSLVFTWVLESTESIERQPKSFMKSFILNGRNDIAISETWEFLVLFEICPFLWKLHVVVKNFRETWSHREVYFEKVDCINIYYQGPSGYQPWCWMGCPG